ncbi:MAG: rod shape-determining protein MreD [Candidatus Methylumidiphilus sp.]
MPQNKPIARLVVTLSLAFAMVLRILPLPHEWFLYNPDWVLLFLVYWAMAIPERVGVGYAWCVGLFCDALTARLLGQHALAYAVVAYVCVKMHRQLRTYPIYQQMLSVLLLLLLEQVLMLWTQHANTASLDYWLPALSGALVWPAVFPILRRLRRRFHLF